MDIQICGKNLFLGLKFFTCQLPVLDMHIFYNNSSSNDDDETTEAGNAPNRMLQKYYKRFVPFFIFRLTILVIHYTFQLLWDIFMFCIHQTLLTPLIFKRSFKSRFKFSEFLKKYDFLKSILMVFNCWFKFVI
jgi:hypothetical protein